MKWLTAHSPWDTCGHSGRRPIELSQHQFRAVRKHQARERDRCELAHLRQRVAELTYETKQIKSQSTHRMPADKKQLTMSEIAVQTDCGDMWHVTRENVEMVVQEKNAAMAELGMMLEKVTKEKALTLLQLDELRCENKRIADEKELTATQFAKLKQGTAVVLRDRDNFEKEVDRLKAERIAFVDQIEGRYEQALFNAVPLPSADHGVIIGLKDSQELNGSLVLCQQGHADRGRWQAQCVDGRVLMLKHDNILRKPARPTSDCSSSESEDVLSEKSSEGVFDEEISVDEKGRRFAESAHIQMGHPTKKSALARFDRTLGEEEDFAKNCEELWPGSSRDSLLVRQAAMLHFSSFIAEARASKHQNNEPRPSSEPKQKKKKKSKKK